MSIDPNTVIVTAIVTLLVVFGLWAALPALRANRARVLRSPATWAVVVLLLAELGVQYKSYEYRKAAEAQKVRMEMVHDLMQRDRRIAAEAREEAVRETIRQLQASLENQ